MNRVCTVPKLQLPSREHGLLFLIKLTNRMRGYELPIRSYGMFLGCLTVLAEKGYIRYVDYVADSGMKRADGGYWLTNEGLAALEEWRL